MIQLSSTYVFNLNIERVVVLISLFQPSYKCNAVIIPIICTKLNKHITLNLYYNIVK